MKGYPSLFPEQKREIVARIKEKGERVADLAKEYGVQPRIIYGYLSRSGQNSGTLLELAKLKREKEALLKIVGQLIVDQKLGKKIQHRYGYSSNSSF
jgi:transposase-like protein